MKYFTLPADFMFVLTRAEDNALRRQIGALERGRHAKYLPMAFTEQGVAMLSTHEDLKRKIEEMEAKYDEQFRVAFEAIRQLLGNDENRNGK